MELKLILEAVLFASEKPMSTRELRDVCTAAAEQSDDPAIVEFRKPKEADLTETLEALERDYMEATHSYRLMCVAGSWQFVSRPEYAPWLKSAGGGRGRAPKLSQPALETLAIIAYRQPLTSAEMEQIRGVSVDGVLQTLIERGLIEQRGRADVVGRPMTFGTTLQFLEYFGLRNLDELPAADELRRIVVEKPEALLTVDPGLATAPPVQLTSDANGEPRHSDTAQSAANPESASSDSAPVADGEDAN